jgi:hypothetical protein
MQNGDMQQATTTFEEVLKLYREVANKWGISYALVHLGMAPLSRGDHAGATRSSRVADSSSSVMSWSKNCPKYV